MLRHAVDEKVGLTIDEDGAAELVGPEVVVRGAAEGGFDASDDDGKAREGAADERGVNERGAVGAPAMESAGGVGVVVTQLAERGVVGEHGVEGAGSDAREEARAAEGGDVGDGGPAGLRDDADAETVGEEPSAEERDAEGRVVDVGVAGDEKDVERIPAETVHLGAGDGEEVLSHGGGAVSWHGFEVPTL